MPVSKRKPNKIKKIDRNLKGETIMSELEKKVEKMADEELDTVAGGAFSP